MADLSRIRPVLTFVMSVAALVLALWPVVADAPCEDGVTSAELSEFLRAEQETSSEDKEPSSEEKEAERIAKCQTADGHPRTLYLELITRRSPERMMEKTV